MVEVSLPILVVWMNSSSARRAYDNQQESAHVTQYETNGCDKCKVLWSSVACAWARTIKKRQQPSKEYQLISELISELMSLQLLD